MTKCEFCQRASQHKFCSNACEIEYDNAMYEMKVLEAYEIISSHIRNTISVIPTDTRIRIAEKLTSLGHQDQSKHAN
tara:strand:+ start:208 stop:438 length:231 start_codon:yes stop_codon:yes gene_type:complete